MDVVGVGVARQFQGSEDINDQNRITGIKKVHFHLQLAHNDHLVNIA